MSSQAMSSQAMSSQGIRDQICTQAARGKGGQGDGRPPLVSVIVPTYNRRAALSEALASVLNQSYRRFEMIVVDDGSDDDTREFLAAHDGAPLRTMRIEHCGMPGAVRNRGAEVARGRYLAFLDSDDLWRHDKLARQTAYMRASGCRISHTRELWVRDGEVVSQRKQRHRRAGFVFHDSLRKCIIGPSTTMITAELFHAHGGFREDLEVAEDYELWLRITAAEEVGYLSDTLTVKRGGASDQLSAKYAQIEGFRITALAQLLERRVFAGSHAGGHAGGHAGNHDDPDCSLEAAAAAEYARKCRIFAAGCRKHGRPEEAQACESRAAELLNRIGQVRADDR